MPMLYGVRLRSRIRSEGRATPRRIKVRRWNSGWLARALYAARIAAKKSSVNAMPSAESISSTKTTTGPEMFGNSTSRRKLLKRCTGLWCSCVSHHALISSSNPSCTASSSRKPKNQASGVEIPPPSVLISRMAVRTPASWRRSAVWTMSEDFPICRAARTLQYSPESASRNSSSSAGRRMYEGASRQSVPPATKNSCGADGAELAFI